MEARGHSVVGHDPADAPREMLRARKLAYRENGADALLEKTRLEVVSMEEMVRRSDIVFVTIQTPHDPRFEGVTRLPGDTHDFDYRFLKTGVSQLSAAVEAQGRD